MSDSYYLCSKASAILPIHFRGMVIYLNSIQNSPAQILAALFLLNSSDSVARIPRIVNLQDIEETLWLNSDKSLIFLHFSLPVDIGK